MDKTKKKSVLQNDVKNLQLKRHSKSLFVSYILWMFGGIFGLHHLYLRRDRHAFVWICTLGGYFGIGWAVEIFKIPSYVREANEDDTFINAFTNKLKRYPKPPFSMTRFTGALMVGYLFGELTKQAIPEQEVFNINWAFLHWLVPLSIALGVWTVGNIGRECGRLWHCLVAAYFSYLVRFFIYDDTWRMSIVLFVTALIFDSYSKHWRKGSIKKQSNLRRGFQFSLAILLYSSLWCSYFYFNGTIVDSEGNEYPVHAAIKQLFSSGLWAELKDGIFQTYQYSRHKGWNELFKELFLIIGQNEEENSLKVLNLPPTATQTEITAAWRQLSKEFHPDKYKDIEEQKRNQVRFMEIQQAYEILSKKKRRRKSKNKKFNEEL